MITWDGKVTPYKDGRFNALIRTGVSTRLRNIQAVYVIKGEGQNALDLDSTVLWLAARATTAHRENDAMPNVPNFLPCTLEIDGRLIHVTVVWGFVVQAESRGMLSGELRLVIVLNDEIETVLDTVFALEDVLTPPSNKSGKKEKRGRARA